MHTNFDVSEAARQRQADIDFARGEVPTWAIVVMITLAALFAFTFMLFCEAAKLWGETRKEAVHYGYATHDPKTGEWQWVVPPSRPAPPAPAPAPGTPP